MKAVMPGAEETTERVREAFERVGLAARGAGRSPGDVTIVAATKGVEPPGIAAALGAGIRVLGENRAQDLLGKVRDPELARRAPLWHFIGRLQSNKVRLLAPHIDVWESIDRPELGAEVAKRAPGAAVFVQVNIDADDRKGGCPPEAAPRLVDHLRSHGLEVRGLMVVPDPAADARRAFDATAALAASMSLRELSMGMSDDFEEAVAAGATFVRLGRALFGSR